MEQQSDTPRTDAMLNEVAAKWSQPEWQQKPVSMFMDEVSDFARQLERELAAARKDAERCRSALSKLIDLAEYWFNREDRRGYSEQQFKSWHALGHGSNTMRDARAAMAPPAADKGE